MRRIVALTLVAVSLAMVQGCTRARVNKLGQTVEALSATSAELRTRADALEARLQNLENTFAIRHDLATRIVGKWTGISIQSDSSGKFREVSGQSISFGGDGSLSEVHVTGLAGAQRYRALNSNAILFSFPGGRQQLATNVEMQGNRLSFLLGTGNPVAVVLTR